MTQSNSKLRLAVRRTGARRIYAASRIRLERLVLSAVKPKTVRNSGRILAYHAIGTPEWGINDVSATQFEGHIHAALNAGFNFVSARKIADGASGPMDLAITFDDGLASVLENAAPIMTKYAIPWTVFVVTGWSDGLSPHNSAGILTWRQMERCMELGGTI